MREGKLFQCKITTTAEFEANASVPDGYVERELAIKIIKDMPIDELRMLFSFGKISHSDKILPSNPDWKNEKIVNMKSRLMSEWTAEIMV